VQAQFDAPTTNRIAAMAGSPDGRTAGLRGFELQFGADAEDS
jgi:hypothetical protein